MDDIAISNLISAWFEMTKAPLYTEKNEENFWAYETLGTLCRNDPALAWNIILRLINQSPSNKIRATIAAGPLEDLLYHHCAEIIDKVKFEADRNPIFRNTLAGVWLSSEDTPLWKQFYEIAGVEPPFPDDE